LSADWVWGGGGLGLRAVATSEEELYRDMTAAVASRVERPAQPRRDPLPDRVPVMVRATAARSLLGEYLEDLLYLVEIERFAPVRLERLVIQDDRLRAALSGWTGDWSIGLRGVRSADVRHEDAAGVWRASVQFALAPSPRAGQSAGE
jgi:hypothetical protein